MAHNCFNESTGTGDPDTGNCTLTPTWSLKVGDCRWSYLNYFYGFAGMLMASDRADASDAWEMRREFLAGPARNPLAANLTKFPPLLTLAGTRDYFYSDGPSLAERACEA
jgi:acetyl esterase/lipase